MVTERIYVRLSNFAPPTRNDFRAKLNRMSHVLSNGATSVELEYGPEWGYRPSTRLALTWDLMTSGRWRRWDAGASRDIYSCTWTWRGAESQVRDVLDLVGGIARGDALTLTSTEGYWPFGPLVDCSTPAPVRVGPPRPGSRLPASGDWFVELDIFLASPPALDLSNRSLARMISEGHFSPSLSAGWDLLPMETGIAANDLQADSHQSVLTAILPLADAQKAIRYLTWVRGNPFEVQAQYLPFGPAVAPSNGAGGHYQCRAKAFSFFHRTADLCEVSATIVRDP